MKIISCFICAYILFFIYESFTESRHHLLRWLCVVFISITRYTAEYVVAIKYFMPLILCTLLILYSMCISSKNLNINNLKCSIVSYGIDYIVNLILGCICGIISGWFWKEEDNEVFVCINVARIIVIICLHKWKDKFARLKQAWIFYIAIVATSILLFAEQIIRAAYTIDNQGFINLGVAGTYLALLFTILWLLDHYKMEKLQKMYADDNRQMSQKLHRSKEILPMIANYVSTMDGTQDEEMRKKLEAVCHDYGKELGGAEMSAEFFETTGIDLADLLLRTKIIECGEQDIELNVFVSTQINEDMKRLDISDGEITRLLGDLLRNAINAVSKLQDKMILLLIARDANDCVLIRVYDSGIPFPPYILEHFGERGYTTWGTGNGLADLMDTVTRVHGSIEINMDMDPGDVFTKEIYICFDGKNTINIVKKENAQREIDANVCMET